MKNAKIWLGILYLILFSIFLYFLFSRFNFEEITTYNFIKSNSEYLRGLRDSNLFLVASIFIVLGIFWISILQGFGLPIVLASGFIFGTYTGTLIIVITLSLGATVTFIIANYFFKDLIKDKFANKFKFLEEKIKLNEFLVIFLLRVIGGTPLQIQNLLPVLFNVKINNYFFGSLLGFLPQAYIFCSLGSGLEKQIEKNIDPPSLFQMITSFEIYAPIIAFFFLLVFAFFFRKFFYKK